MSTQKQTTFVGTLGGQPQIITFALDDLLTQKKISITEVVLLHFSPSQPRVKRALKKLKQEFEGDHYQGMPIRFRPIPISADSHILHDIRDESDTNIAWNAITQLFIELKSTNRTLHVCISGGRRILGLLTMSAAMLHFGHQDVLWHMYTQDDLRRKADEGAILHLPDPRSESEFNLIRVPALPWGNIFPALRQLAQMQIDPHDPLAAPRKVIDEEEKAKCQLVFNQLSSREKEVLQEIANGLNPQQIAESLAITISTVNSHKTVILAECRNAWNLPDEKWLNYHFIAKKFEQFFSSE